MTVASALPMDVLAGIPEPTRKRWQPLRAGILNLYLYLYDEQVFTFHNGRLLLRGNNGTGKSMALVVWSMPSLRPPPGRLRTITRRPAR